MSRPRTCHITTVDISLARLLKSRLIRLKEKGFDIETMSAPGPYLPELEQVGLRHIGINSLTRRWSLQADISAFFQIYQHLRKNKYDIVNTYSPKAGIFGRIAAKLAGIPIVVHTSWGLYFTDDSSWSKRAFFLALEAVAARFCDHIFSVNRDDIITMLKYKIITPDKVSYLGNATDIDNFHPKKLISRLSKRREFGIKQDHIVVGIVGRLVKEKGYKEFFSVAREIKSRHGNVTFVSIGPLDPDKKDAISEAEIGQLEQEQVVYFLGMQSDMPEIYGMLDIVVLPSYREGFPRSLVEASAMARPIITTDTRGCREAVEHEITGLLVPVGSSEALEKAIEFLIDNPSTREKFGEAGRQKAIREFDERILVRRIASKYKELCGYIN